MSLMIDTGFFPNPKISKIAPNIIKVDGTTTINIKGSYFTENTIFKINGLTIENFNYISSSEIEIVVQTTNSTGEFNIFVENESGEVITIESGITVTEITWVDLREGGEELEIGTDIRVRSGMQVFRDSGGMYFTGQTPWSSWTKFEKYIWNRSENKTLEWIVSGISGNFMIGIASNATVETSTAQFSQFETTAYFQNANSLWGLYGNNGTVGSAGNQSDSVSVDGLNETYKIRFEDSGSVGSRVSVFRLPSNDIADWDDDSNIIKIYTVGGTLNPDENVIMPAIIAFNGGTARYVALRVSDEGTFDTVPTVGL